MKFIITALLFLCTTISYSQDCQSSTAGLELIQNRYKQNVLIGNNTSNALSYVAEDDPTGSIDLRRYASLAASSNIWISGKGFLGYEYFAGARYEIDGKSDWHPGPLDELGNPLQEGCEYWDQIFYFSKKEIFDHYHTAFINGLYDPNYNCEEIPDNIRNWPGRGNPLIPDLPEGQLADFWDYNQDGIYNPCMGDLPFVSIRNCDFKNIVEALDYYPEQVAFWIRNDATRDNPLTNSAPMKIQLHTYVFNFLTPGRNGIIYWKYDIISKNPASLEDVHFAVWTDIDLGCKSNDFIGCDVERGMVFAYNETALDQTEQCEEDNEPSFTESVPMFGYALLKGLNQNSGIDDLFPYGLTAVYIPESCDSSPNPNHCEPDQDVTEYHNVMRGLYPDGSEIKNPDGETTTFMYPDNPGDPTGWSMCTADPLNINTTVIMSTGGENAILSSNKSHQVIMAGYILEEADYPCPDLTALKSLKDMAGSNYWNCFYNFDGPTAPNLIAELDDTGMTIRLDNNFPGSNNVDEMYFAPVKSAPPHLDENYHFEGYKIYQVGSADFDISLLNDPAYSKLVYQADLENEASDLYNWIALTGSGSVIYNKVLQVEGANMGIHDEIFIDKDYLNDQPFDFNKEYYYVAISYAYNNWEEFDSVQGTGQRRPYVQSTRNIKVTASKTLSNTHEPSPISSWNLSTRMNSFSISNFTSDLNVRIFTNNGQEVKKWNIFGNTTFNSGDLSNELKSGIYFISISNENGNRQTSKLVIIR